MNKIKQYINSNNTFFNKLNVNKKNKFEMHVKQTRFLKKYIK